MIGTSRKGLSVVSTQRATGGCLRDIGTRGLTHGAFIHEFQMAMTPSFVIQFFINLSATKVLLRYREKQERENKRE